MDSVLNHNALIDTGSLSTIDNLFDHHIPGSLRTMESLACLTIIYVHRSRTHGDYGYHI